MPDDADRPVLGQPKFLTVVALGADQTHHIGLLGFERFVDVLGSYAELLGIDHRIERPLHDQHPVVVAKPHHGRQGLFRDHVRQDGVVDRLGEIEP